jgi:hypothetical protein
MGYDCVTEQSTGAEALNENNVQDALATVLDPLDEVHGCVKVLLNWDRLSDALRRELLLRALHNTDRAVENLTGHSVSALERLRALRA